MTYATSCHAKKAVNSMKNKSVKPENLLRLLIVIYC